MEIKTLPQKILNEMDALMILMMMMIIGLGRSSSGEAVLQKLPPYQTFHRAFNEDLETPYGERFRKEFVIFRNVA